mgnify:CR=1 FL=1
MTEKQLKKLERYYKIIKPHKINPVTLYLDGLVSSGRLSMKSLLKTATTIFGFEGKLEEMPWNIIEYQHLVSRDEKTQRKAVKLLKGL